MTARGVLARVDTRSVLVAVVSLAVLGSGFLNLFSLIGPAIPERLRTVTEIFPLGFVHLSRFVVLVVGFTLVVSSVSIFRRKRRAYHVVLFLLCLSAVFHLTKGLDYEEAALCLALIAVLLFLRRSFTVKSAVPEPSIAAAHLFLALLAAFAYGVAGFWFLDKREFGVEFTLGDSIYRTFRFFTLAGDPSLVPRTRYAEWFLDSLYVISIMAIGYSVISIFRPVVYMLRTLPRERLLAQSIVERHGFDSQDYFKVWPDKSFYFSPSGKSFVAYSVASDFAVALADPVGPPEEAGETIRGFAEFCRENDWRVAFHQVLPRYLPVYKELGFRKIKIGSDAVVDVKNFSLSGTRMKDLRNNSNKMEKAGIRITTFEPPLGQETLRRLKEVSDEWLSIPGRRERGFTLGRFDPAYVGSTPVFAAEDSGGNMLAFVNLIPSYCPGEATVDLMRRRSDVPNGLMDYLMVKLLENLRGKGYERFNLGMAPMSDSPGEGEGASIEEKTIYFFSRHMNSIFSFSGLKHYKSKFASYWEPRYTVYKNPLDLPKLAIAIGELTELGGRVTWTK